VSNYFILLGVLSTLKNHPLLHNIKSPSWVSYYRLNYNDSLSIQGLLECPHPTVGEVASTLGLLISNVTGAELGPLHFRSLAMDKTEALRLNKGNFDTFILLSELSRSDFQWWANSARSLHKPISLPQQEVTLYTDASTEGCGDVLNNVKIGGIVDSSRGF